MHIDKWKCALERFELSTQDFVRGVATKTPPEMNSFQLFFSLFNTIRGLLRLAFCWMG